MIDPTSSAAAEFATESEPAPLARAAPEPAVVAPPPAPTQHAPASSGRRALERGALIVLAVVAVIACLRVGRAFFVPLAAAWLLSAALKPAVRVLERARVPAPVGAGIVLAVFGVVALAGMQHFVAAMDAWLAELPARLSAVRDRLEPVLEPIGRWTRATAQVTAIAGATPAPAAADSGAVESVLDWTKTLLIRTLEILVLLYFLLAAGDRFRQKLMRVMPTLRDKKRALEISRELEENVSVFFFTISCINVAFGALLWLALGALGLPQAAFWGVVAAVLNFIPYVGPFVGVGGLLFAGLTAFDNVGAGLAPAAIYLLLHLLESNFVTPSILGRRLRLNPLVLFVSLLFWTWLWGIPGALLAVPLLMCLRIVAERVERLSPLVEFLDR